VKAFVARLEEWKKKKKEKGSEVAKEEVELTEGKCESMPHFLVLRLLSAMAAAIAKY
jgi:hypothetical protein